MNDFFRGLSAPIQGARLILSHRELKAQAIYPVLLTLVVLFAGVFSGLYFSADIISLLFSKWISPEGGFVSTVLTILGYILITVFVFLFSYLFAAIVAIPFNTVLAEKALRILGVNQTKPHVLKMLRASLVKSLFIFILLIAMFLGSFIPGVSLAVMYLGLMLLAFDCMDYSLEALGLSFKERIGYLRNHLLETSGFAAVLGLIFLVPLLNFLLLPIAVVGGAHLVGKNVKK